jgi:hypothetical protein
MHYISVTDSTDFDLMRIQTLNFLFLFRWAKSVGHPIQLRYLMKACRCCEVDTANPTHHGTRFRLPQLLVIILKKKLYVYGCERSIWLGQRQSTSLGLRKSAQSHQLREPLKPLSLYHLTHCPSLQSWLHSAHGLSLTIWPWLLG